MGGEAGDWMLRIACIGYLLLFGSITIWGARKVDDTMTVYLWKMIRLFREMKIKLKGGKV